MSINSEYLAHAQAFARRYTSNLGNLKARKGGKASLAIFNPEHATLMITGLGRDKVHGMRIIGDERLAAGEVLLTNKVPAPEETVEVRT